MKIAIVCDSFKESLTAIAVAEAIQAGFQEIFPEAEFIACPAADGGEGTVSALVAATKGKLVEVSVAGPLGTPVEAFYGVTGDGRTAVIEMAAAAGLEMLSPEQRDPGRATTRGVGELIRHALDEGCRHFIVGLGGSATNDGAAGLAQALGARLLDDQGRELEAGGLALSRLARIDVSNIEPRLVECTVEVACDVDNPLLGLEGASAVFGPQKGASAELVASLDNALAVYAQRLEEDLGKTVADIPGAGAAGGAGAGTLAFLNARLRPGFDIVSEMLGLEELLRPVDLVITGEGRIDGQTIRGKTPAGVAEVARRLGKPVIAFGGSLGPDVEKVHAIGIEAVFASVSRPCTLAEALAEARPNLIHVARNVAATLRLGMTLSGKTDRV
ncbi:glycerate kinase [Acetobacter aceti NRIC 0242]|uniref:Glycerate kinase n=1 Tax=Acetobacter aceti NBRC 14818 TaxID=887700 RepID=A0AB33IE29_ACEAC|nr:glycerate kinase [Acetobacter aceti]TCS32553.1 glycerate kinase [Acetobacter aceti NBRC 14818]BCK75076.1 glycerate kinase [Acetobacter aceti NBRC 14818]GAN57032.1 glycerate kinase [Acetobacter aceti NBRC 14818]GBO80744.1 glycerate kinase [Acetobacter aceti NRIC 0242]